MTIQSTTAITSNSYFAWLFPLYILNIIPAMVADILIFRYSEKKKASSLLSKIHNTIDNRAEMVFDRMVFDRIYYRFNVLHNTFLSVDNWCLWRIFWTAKHIKNRTIFRSTFDSYNSALYGTSIYSFFPARRTGSPATDKFKEILVQVLSRQRIKHGVHLFN